MRHQTATLTGAALDYAVAMAEEFPVREGHGPVPAIEDGYPLVRATFGGCERFQPSRDWSHGGPIIEREHISVNAHGPGKVHDNGKMPDSFYRWHAMLCTGRTRLTGAPTGGEWEVTDHFGCLGETALQAAMRCFVASKLGDTVEVPDAIAL